MRCEHGEGPSANGGGGAKTGGRVEGKGRGQDQRVREQGPGEGGGAEGERGQPPCARVRVDRSMNSIEAQGVKTVPGHLLMMRWAEEETANQCSNTKESTGAPVSASEQDSHTRCGVRQRGSVQGELRTNGPHEPYRQTVGWEL